MTAPRFDVTVARAEPNAKTIASWRLSIAAARIQLGEFNWPWALGLALDLIEAQQAALDRVAALCDEAEQRARSDAKAETSSGNPDLLRRLKASMPARIRSDDVRSALSVPPVPEGGK